MQNNDTRPIAEATRNTARATATTVLHGTWGAIATPDELEEIEATA